LDADEADENVVHHAHARGVSEEIAVMPRLIAARIRAGRRNTPRFPHDAVWLTASSSWPMGRLISLSSWSRSSS